MSKFVDICSLLSIVNTTAKQRRQFDLISFGIFGIDSYWTLLGCKQGVLSSIKIFGINNMQSLEAAFNYKI